MTWRTRWLVVVLFAIAMAWMESATVYYLRLMIDRIDPHQANPLPLGGIPPQVELVREAATLVMLATLGALAGRTAAMRVGYAAVAFGVWDIFYYVFLRLFTGWPGSLLDWDILFLIPLPWWGPVLAPVSIASLMVVGGTMASRSAFEHPPAPLARALWRLHCVGLMLALYVFMADSIDAVRHGLDVTQVLPTTFNWPVFWLAFTLMAAPMAQSAWPLGRRRDQPHNEIGTLPVR